MSTREEFEKKLENSFENLKTSIFWLQLTRWEIENRIKKVLEKENEDIRRITEFKYKEWLSISEIAYVINKSETIVCAHLDYIISRINSIIWVEKQEFKKTNTGEHILDIKG